MNTIIKNVYYLVAGILAIIFSISLAWNGQTNILVSLNEYVISEETKSTFFYIWHINTVENLLFGIAFILMSISKDLSKVRFTAWIICLVMTARWIVILGSTLIYNAKAFGNTWKESLAFAIFISIIFLGIRVKDKLI